MKQYSIFYSVAFAVLLTIMQQVFIHPKATLQYKHLQVGQYADADIIAPFDFPVLKSAQLMKTEQQDFLRSLKTVYTISDDIQFEVLKKWDDVFLPLLAQTLSEDTVFVRRQFETKDIRLSKRSLAYIQNKLYLQQVYELGISWLPALYKKGIYPERGIGQNSVVMTSEGKTFTKGQLVSAADATQQLIAKASYYPVRSILLELLPQVLAPNVIKDDKKTEEMRKHVLEGVSRTSGQIHRNEIIVSKNARITEEDLNKIQSLTMAMYDKNLWHHTSGSILTAISLFCYQFFLAMLLSFFLQLWYPHLINNHKMLLLVFIGMIFNVALALINNLVLQLPIILVPYSLVIMTLALLIDIPFAVFYNILSVLSIYPFINWEIVNPTILMLSTLAVLFLMYKLRDKQQYLIIWVYLTLCLAAFVLIFGLSKHDSLIVIVKNLGYIVISSTISVVLLILIIPFLETRLNIATKRRLLELLDFNHPLLKRLATEAVGSYHHSLIVGNLSERAAEAIGANPLLARVGSYYHDIGKVLNPQYFTENNPDSSSLHEQLTPAESAAIIKSHVIDGLELAVKHKLPQQVTDIISQHHGTGYIKYFLDKAEKSRLPINLEDFRYDGPKPLRKEAALVMLSDVIESITKSYPDIFEVDVNKIIDDVIIRLIKEGQFDDCPLTLKEINQAKDSMIITLESVFRTRLQYPAEQD